MIERKHVEAISGHWDRIFNDPDAALRGISDTQIVACCALSAAISAALSAADESPWRSMESAPKDGSYMLLMLGDRMVVGYWSPLIQSCVYACLPVTASHWMPLPAAPEVKP